MRSIKSAKTVPASRRVGLARALSKLGCCSRSQAVEWIRDGRVTLNGKVRRDPETPSYTKRDRIAVDGHVIAPPAKLYLMLNKPRGVVTTASDERGRATVYSLLSEDLPWVGPVGRLDKASEGLLLLTNDSEWAARVLAPETHLDKTYHMQVRVIANAALLESLVTGVRHKGDYLRVKNARLLRSGQRNSWLEVVLDEGKNRHIRRIFDKLEIQVLRLMRVAIGPLQLGQLAKGSFRVLTESEKRLMDEAMESSGLERYR